MKGETLKLLMRNLKVTSCSVYAAADLLKDAQSFCLDCDSGSVWVATSNSLCCIDTTSKVKYMALMQ